MGKKKRMVLLVLGIIILGIANKNDTVASITEAAMAIMRDNRETLVKIGANGRETLHGTHKGRAYQLTVDKGHIVQFFPK